MNVPLFARMKLNKTITGFLLWNLCVFGLWLWSREGSVVRLRMDVEENHHSLFCNGTLVDSFDLMPKQYLTSGRPGLGLTKDSRPPLIVAPQELYDLTVTDIHSGRVLWDPETPFKQDDWTMMKGQFVITGDNRLRTDFMSMGSVGDPEWSNYSIEVTCANPTELYIFFRVTDSENYGRAQLRFWRELVVGIGYYKDGTQIFHKIKSLAEPLDQGLRSLTLRFVKTYAVACLILLGFLIVFTLFSYVQHIIFPGIGNTR